MAHFHSHNHTEHSVNSPVWILYICLAINLIFVAAEAFAIPEVQNGENAGGMSWRYEMTFDVNKVMEVCKANNCTPAILMSILMQKGVKSINPDAAEQVLCR